jgi:hypothetical protein
MIISHNILVASTIGTRSVIDDFAPFDRVLAFKVSHKGQTELFSSSTTGFFGPESFPIGSCVFAHVFRVRQPILPSLL